MAQENITWVLFLILFSNEFLTLSPGLDCFSCRAPPRGTAELQRRAVQAICAAKRVDPSGGDDSSPGILEEVRGQVQLCTDSKSRGLL